MARAVHLLFVCVENSCRSQMAEGFARAMNDPRVAAYSAGSRPSGRIDPRAVAFMAERGIDLSGQTSKGLEDLPRGVAWNHVVTMGCGDACPHLPARHRLEWDLQDPKELGEDAFRQVGQEIERRVRALVEESREEPGLEGVPGDRAHP